MPRPDRAASGLQRQVEVPMMFTPAGVARQRDEDADQRRDHDLRHRRMILRICCHVDSGRRISALVLAGDRRNPPRTVSAVCAATPLLIAICARTAGLSMEALGGTAAASPTT